MATEPVFYSDTFVSVTPSLITLRGATYTVANITSAKVDPVPPSRAPALAVLGLSLLVCYVASQQDGMLVLGLVAVGLVVGLASLLLLVAAKPSFAVRLTMASGEIRTLGVFDEKRGAALYQAIHRAIAERGTAMKLNVQV